MLVALVFLGAYSLNAQKMLPPSNYEISKAPQWAQAMYGEDPNVMQIDALYHAFYKDHPFQKSYHTQYYKRWRRRVDAYISADGHVDLPSPAELKREHETYMDKRNAHASRTGSGWSVVGPGLVRDDNGAPRANQTNIYSLAQCSSSPNVMYAGTEPGEVYKSTDSGQSWLSVFDGVDHPGGLRAVGVDPADPDHVIASSNAYIFTSTDGGANWSRSYITPNFNANEIQFHPTNSNVVFIASMFGLMRSTDGGNNWVTQFSTSCYDIKFNPINPSKAYLLKNNSGTNSCEFFMSSDTGATWTIQTTGWYSSSDPNRNDGGGRLAVTAADSNRVYAYLIGEAKANDDGYIGVYRSDDGGTSWTLPNGPAGGPYTTNHPNLAVGTTTWNYHQGYYNCALMADQANPDRILIGGLNLWRSDDGGLTFTSVSGYIGGPLNMHVDNQDFRVFGNDYYVTTDGGIYYSTDFFTTQPAVRMNGIHGSDYWGFGSGWNEDVLVGGLYHNGNLAWYQNYTAGDFLSLGGGEAPTGYVNPGDNRRTFFSDIGGRIIPQSIGGATMAIPFGLSPNESYWVAESSELEPHPNCYNISYLGKDNQLWRTRDGGASFGEVYTFGSNTNARITAIEISSSNPDVIYLNQQVGGSTGYIWKSTDGGQTWTNLNLPGGSTNKRKILLQVDPEDENRLFIAYPLGSNGLKIFKTEDGGTSWTNLTTPMLDGTQVHSLVFVPNTNDGLYYCDNRTVYYKDNSLGNWSMYNANLPVKFDTDIARPFYRDSKLRIASYGKGIWEADLNISPSRPVARPMVNQLQALCENETFDFEDFSILNHSGASWAWQFENGTPTTSSMRNPSVTFTGLGLHKVILTVTDGNGQSDTDSIFIDVTGISTVAIAEDFEGIYPPNEWAVEASGNLSWTQTSTAGGYGLSPTSAYVDNFGVDGAGTYVDLIAPINLNNTADAMLYWDVAYAQYGGQYTDTMEILISLDCGATFSQLYRQGGLDLATAPNSTTSYTPAANEWRTDSLDLSSYQGNDKVLIAFRDIGHWGNNLYLDNINLSGTPIVGLEAEPQKGYAQLAPNPVPNGSPVRLISDLSDEFTVRVFDAKGKVILERKMEAGESFVPALSSGIYFYDLKGDAIWKRGRLVLLNAR